MESAKKGKKEGHKCRNDPGNETCTTTRIQDLCSEDKKRIAQLVWELAKCSQQKYNIAADLSASKIQIEKLQDQLLLMREKKFHENELKLELLNTKAKLNKLKLQTSLSLKCLTQQIMGFENQLTEVLRTARDIANDKIYLCDILYKEHMVLEKYMAKVDETKNIRNTDKLLLSRKTTNNHRMEARKQTGSCLKPKIREIDLEKYPQIIQVKDQRDLNIPSTEATLLRELFFNRSNINEIERLFLFPAPHEN